MTLGPNALRANSTATPGLQRRADSGDRRGSVEAFRFSPAEVLDLQKKIGNAAVASSINQARPSPPAVARHGEAGRPTAAAVTWEKGGTGKGAWTGVGTNGYRPGTKGALVTDGPIVTQRQDGPPKETQKDLTRLEELAGDENTGPVVSAVIKELLDLVKKGKIVDWQNTSGGGSTHPKYKKVGDELEIAGYTVTYPYQVWDSTADRVRHFVGELFGLKLGYRGPKDDATRIGTLVHELTHVSVSERLKKDFVNYIHADQPEKPKTAMEKTGAGDQGWATEASLSQRQREWSVQPAVDQLGKNLVELQVALASLEKVKLLEAGKLSSEPSPEEGAEAESRKAQVKTVLGQVAGKLTYAQTNPSIDYDSCLNQIIVWWTLWKSDKDNDFYGLLARRVAEAHHRRTTATPLYTGATPPSVEGTGGAQTEGVEAAVA